MAFLDDYEPVEDRLVKFWSRHPGGQVVTELVEHGEGSYIVMASLYRGDELREGRPAATGFAREVETQRGVNSTSALENCETSAIGRALANMGFAAKGKRPSREEMSKTAGAASHGEDDTAPASATPAPTRNVAASTDGAGDPTSAVGGAPDGDGGPSAVQPPAVEGSKEQLYSQLVGLCADHDVKLMATLAESLERTILVKDVPEKLSVDDLKTAIAHLAAA